MRTLHFHVADALAGFFKMTAIRPDGRRRPLTGWQPNILTDNGMDNFGYGGTSIADQQGWIAYCRVGTGQTPPAFSDGNLDIPIAEVATGSRTYGTSGQTGPPHYHWQRDVYTFLQGNATGIITEVGLGPKLDQPRNGISTRALVVDEFGDPATVPVLADEQLEVVYEIRTYFTDVSVRDSTMTIDSTLYDTKRLPMNIDSSATMSGLFGYGAGVRNLYLYQGTTLPNIGADHYGEPIDLMESVSATRVAYGSGLFYRDSTCAVQKTQGEYGTKGVTAIGIIGYLSDWQMSFTQRGNDFGIPHNATNIMNVALRHSWTRYTP